MPQLTALRGGLQVQAGPSGGYAGEVRASIDPWAERWPEGTGAAQADLYLDGLHTLAGGAAGTHDLRNSTQGPGGAGVVVSMAEVRALHIEVPASASAGVSLAPAAVDGWIGLLASAGDALRILPGCRLVVACPTDGSYPTTSTSKAITLANLSPTLSTFYRLTIVGTSV